MSRTFHSIKITYVLMRAVYSEFGVSVVFDRSLLLIISFLLVRSLSLTTIRPSSTLTLIIAAVFISNTRACE